MNDFIEFPTAKTAVHILARAGQRVSAATWYSWRRGDTAMPCWAVVAVADAMGVDAGQVARYMAARYMVRRAARLPTRH